jgi:hypothetical protein
MTDLRSKSRQMLKDDGWHVETVERWCSFTKRKHDLFGFLDLLCLKGTEILGVQVTSKSHRAEHVTKIANHENTPKVREANIAIHLHLWEKKGRLWTLTVENLS